MISYVFVHFTWIFILFISLISVFIWQLYGTILNNLYNADQCLCAVQYNVCDANLKTFLSSPVFLSQVLYLYAFHKQFCGSELGFQCGSGSSIFCHCGSGLRFLLKGLKFYSWLKNLNLEFKIAIFISQVATMKDVQATREAFSPPKRTSRT